MDRMYTISEKDSESKGTQEQIERSEQKPKNALVLEGGAMRGIFSAGVLDVMMENGIQFDAVIGVSAGAAFGCNYKSHQPGRVIRYNMRFAKDWKYCSLRSLLLTGDMYGAKYCYHTLPKKLDVMDKKTYDSDPSKFIVVCTDVTTGKPVYHELPELNDSALEWVRASASMPIVSRVVHVDGYRLLDGGISDSIPVQYAQNQGYDRIVTILTQPKDYVKKPVGHDRTYGLLLHKYPRVAASLRNRHIMYNREKKRVHTLDAKGVICAVYPKKALSISRTERDIRKIEKTYQEGRKRGKEMLPRVREYLGQ